MISLRSFPHLRSLLKALGTVLFMNTLPASGQDVSVKFRVITWQAEDPAAFSYIHNGKPTEIKNLSTTLRSPFYDYKGPATLLLYPPGKAASDEKPSAVPLASIKIPTTMRYPLLVIVPNPDGPAPYRALVLEDDPAKFPFGNYFFQNFSNRKVAAEMGTDRFTLDPAGTHLVNSDQKALHLRLAVSEESEGGWKIIYDNFYPNWIERRSVIFTLDTMREGKPHLELRTLLENKAVWDAAMKPQKTE